MHMLHYQAQNIEKSGFQGQIGLPQAPPQDAMCNSADKGSQVLLKNLGWRDGGGFWVLRWLPKCLRNLQGSGLVFQMLGGSWVLGRGAYVLRKSVRC